MDSRHGYSLLLACILAIVGNVACAPSNEPAPPPTIEPSEPPPTTTISPTATATMLPSPIPTPTPTSPPLKGRIFVTAWGGEVSEVYVMNADGSDLTHLFDLSPNDGFPVWSPDGQQAAFAPIEIDPVVVSHIFVLSLADNELIQFTRNTEAPDLSPAWSPDGQQIAFVSCRYPSWQIYVMDADCVTLPGGCDNNLVRLTDGVGLIGCLSWSPDGQKIAFHRLTDVYPDLFVVDVNTLESVQLTDNRTKDSCPAWSPDGKHIAFASDRNGNQEIYTMDVDGTNVTRLTDNPASDAAPEWSPDGLWIAFQSGREGKRDIYVMRPDGSSMTRITDGSHDFVQPTWLPDDVLR